MVKIHASLSSTNILLNTSRSFVVVIRRDSGFGISVHDLKVIDNLDDLLTIKTGRVWNARDRLMGNTKKDAYAFAKAAAGLGIKCVAKNIADNSRYGGCFVGADAIKVHPVNANGEVGDGITLVRIGNELYTPVEANRWLKEFASRFNVSTYSFKALEKKFAK